MMTDHELNMLMQSLTDEEVGSLYASLPESADAAAADRIADRFYQKCAAAGMPVAAKAKPKKRPILRVKYLGFSAAACVAVAVSAAAYYNSQTEKPGVIPETTAAVTVTETTQTETVTTAAATTAAKPAKTTAAQTTTETASQTTAAETTAAKETAKETTTVTETTTASKRTETERTTASTAETRRTTASSAVQTSTTARTEASTTSEPMKATSASYVTTTTQTYMSASTYTTSFTTTEIVVSSAAEMQTTVSTTTTTTGGDSNKGGTKSDHAAIWLVHAPFCNTYHVGEDIDLTGARVGIWYYSCRDGLLESEQSVLLTERPELFTIDASAYRADTPGTYPIRVIYDRGSEIGSNVPSPAKSVNIYVTVIE